MAQPNNPFEAFGSAPPSARSQGGTSYDPFTQGPPSASYQPGGTAPAPQFTTNEESSPQFAPQGAQTNYQQPPQSSQMASPYPPTPSSVNVAPSNPPAYPPAPVPQQQQPMQTQQPFSSNALVVSNQPSNPYAGMVAAEAPVDPFAANQQSQSLVAAPQQNSSWSMQPPASTLANSFDPFAAPPPPPAPAPPQVVPTPAVPPPAPTVDAFNLYSSEQQAPPHQLASIPVQNPPPYAAAAPPPSQDPYGSTTYDQHQDTERNQSNSTELTPYQQNQQQPSPHVNKYSQTLVATAPSNSAPLPNSAKVMKSGFVLARISFRTILLKKWKQSYWVQYGDHTMLWFRSHSDFDDWLNNPYHTQQQRNFLIKLAVNFVHDLYKPNVRGYQVTQARKKTYKNQILKQFKLERWMDYGPTIAAAFASSDPKEVDELRQAIVECMRNTPVGDGIRATGAVRQDNGLQNDNSNENNNRAAPMPPQNNDSGYYQSSSQTVASASEVPPQINFDNQISAPEQDNQSVFSAPAYASQETPQNYAQNQPQNYAQNQQNQFNYQNYAY